MAQLNNCPVCCQGMWVDQWGNPCDPHCTGSNMSLNITPAPYPGVNPMWMGTWHGPPPSSMPMYPYGMPVGHMHHDMHSRPQSRAPSPSHSVKSRKSYMSKKSRRRYRETEDSDDDDRDERRSIRSERKPSSTRFTERKIPLRDSASMPREMLRRNTFDRLERASLNRSRHSMRASSSESDDEYQSDSQKDSELLEEDEEEPMTAKGSKDARSLANIPESTWECEHCTFVNNAGTRVCSICCKTPTTHAIKLVNNNSKQSNANELLAPKFLTSKLKEKQKSRSSDDYSKDYSETESLQNKLGKMKVTDEKQAKKGRTIRKISFWPGTKFSAFQK